MNTATLLSGRYVLFDIYCMLKFKLLLPVSNKYKELHQVVYKLFFGMVFAFKKHA
jgi:hypothetical protein